MRHAEVGERGDALHRTAPAVEAGGFDVGGLIDPRRPRREQYAVDVVGQIRPELLDEVVGGVDRLRPWRPRRPSTPGQARGRS